MENRNITEREREKILDYLRERHEHGTNVIEFEGSTKNITMLFRMDDFIRKVENASMALLNSWFMVWHDSVHVRELNFSATRKIDVKTFMTKGWTRDKAKREGSWRKGEAQLSKLMNGKHLGNLNNHQYDYVCETPVEWLMLVGDREMRVEVKHIRGWMDRSRNDAKKNGTLVQTEGL